MGDNAREKKSVISRAREIIDNYQGKEIRIMEVCGTHTHEIFRLGLRQILPPPIRLISGPGCPVCVTPVSFIDEAVILATDHNVTICTFGDLVRVPGSGLIPTEAGDGASGGKPATAARWGFPCWRNTGDWESAPPSSDTWVNWENSWDMSRWS